MENQYLASANKIIAQAKANSYQDRLDMARKRCFQVALGSCATAGVGWLCFGALLLFSDSQAAMAAFAGMVIIAIISAWTASLCMSFTARPSIRIPT